MLPEFTKAILTVLYQLNVNLNKCVLFRKNYVHFYMISSLKYFGNNRLDYVYTD